MNNRASTIMKKVNALLNKARASNVGKTSTRVEVLASTVREVSALDMLKAQIRGRPPIVEASIRDVYDWFINWAAEFDGVSLPVSYRAYKNEYGYLPALPDRMMLGRRAGEPICEGSSEVWKIEQPPLRLSKCQIGHCLKWLIDNGYLVEELLIDCNGSVRDSLYFLLTDARGESSLLMWLELGYRFGQSLKRVV